MPAETKAECRLVDAEFDRLEERTTALSTAAHRHIADCPRCHLLYDCAGPQAAEAAVSAEAIESARKNLTAGLRPVEPVRSVAATTVLLCLAFIALAIPMMAMTRMGGFNAMRWWQMLPMTAIFAGGALLLCLSAAWQMVPGRLQRVSGNTLLMLLPVAFVTGTLCLFPWRMQEEFLRSGLHCLFEGTAMALPALALFGVFLRRGAPVAPEKLGSTAGILAGLLGVAVLQFACPLQNTPHLAVWHSGVLIITALAGTALGQFAGRTLSVRH